MYREFTRTTITATGSLSILAHADREDNEKEKLESWVPDWSTEPTVDPLSNDEEPFYSATGNSSASMVPSDNKSVLALTGVFIDKIAKTSPGPNSDMKQALNKGQRFIARGTQFGLAESTPLLPYRSLGFMKSKTSQESSLPNAPFSPDHRIPRKPVSVTSSPSIVQSWDQGKSPSLHSTEKFVESPANLSSMSLYTTEEEVVPKVPSQRSTNSSLESPTLSKSSTASNTVGNNITKLLARGIFTGLMRDPCVRQNQRVWGSIHPVNGVYMKAGLEASWKAMLPQSLSYPTGEPMEEAYWRTLVGNKRTAVDDDIDTPPDYWKHAYHIWQEMMQDRQGLLHNKRANISNVVREVSTKVPSLTREDPPPTLERRDSFDNQPLRNHFQAENARRERRNRSEQLNIPAFRNILSTLIKVHNLTCPYEQVAPGVPNTELTANLDNYDNLDQEALARLNRKLSALPTARLSDEELRNQIDKAFWYDFVRVARDRQFCVTRDGYMGWVPPAARVGDRICLLVGGQVPYVVRPHSKKRGHWEFVGEAYVHGVMMGEGLRKPGVKRETIRLL